MPGLQKIPKEAILAAIEKLGPCQPIDVRKELKLGDTFLIGALLSEMVADGTLGISKTRRGGSPFYFQLSKPETLEAISQYLNEKDRRTCAMLKEQRVMREDSQEPLVRVGLQSISDFSKRVEIDGVVYWRHFLVDENEARNLVESTPKMSKSSSKSSEAQVEAQKEIEAQKEQKDEKMKTEEKKEITAETKEAKPDAAVVEKKAKKPRAPRTKKTPVTQATLAPSSQNWLVHDTLYERVQKYATSVSGVVTNPTSIRPNSELTCVLTTEGPYGRLSVFLYALNKKKFGEKDVTRALLSARGQGMSLLVLSVEPFPAKLPKAFADHLNVYFRSF